MRAASLDSHASVLAHHLYQAGGVADTTRTARVLLLAGKQALGSGAFEETVQLSDHVFSLELGEQDPLLGEASQQHGEALAGLQRYDDAVVALKRNTKLQPMSPYGWYQLARVHAERHAPDEAVKIIRHLKGFEPKVAAQLERETGLVA